MPSRSITEALRGSLGDLHGAIRDFSEAIRLRPDYARAFHDRGATRGRKGDAAGAQQDKNRAIELGWRNNEPTPASDQQSVGTSRSPITPQPFTAASPPALKLLAHTTNPRLPPVEMARLTNAD